MGESCSLKEVKTPNMIKFIKHHVIYYFGIPRRTSTIIDPNSSAKHFKNSATNLEFKVSSTAHYLVANGLAEVFNKIIEKLLKKFTLRRQHD